MSDNLTQRVIKVVAGVKNVAPESIGLDNSLEELGVDSLDSVSIVFDLESEFKIEIEAQDAAAARTVADLVEGVRRLTGAASGEPATAAA
jgi:acyl carrier protein